MVVVDDTTCMVDFAKFFLQFTAMESCGKCVPCRIGSQRLLEILERISAGEGELADIERLERLSDDIIEGSLCALGGSAPFPVLSTIRYFRDEVEAHIVDRRCPAKVCRPLIRYKVNKQNCTGCYVCNISCPVKAISGEKKQIQKINQRLCTKCDTCRQVCKFEAIDVETGVLATAAGRSK
jgi:NADH-quinone oxidoreductase subunit F